MVDKSNHRFAMEAIIFGGSEGFRLFSYKKVILSLKNIKKRIKTIIACRRRHTRLRALIYETVQLTELVSNVPHR